MDSPLSHLSPAAAVRTSDRKVANVLGITDVTRDTATYTPNVHHPRPSRLPVRLDWLRRKFTPSPSPSPPPSFVWDIPNPFAFPLPRPADVVQARIEHERRYESVGPLEPVTYYEFDPEYDGYDVEEDDYEDLDDDEDSYDSDSDDGDADDEDEDEDENENEDSDFDAMDAVHGRKLSINRPLNMPIALPQLLHNVPLCFLTSSIDVQPALSEAETRVPSPPMLLLYPSSESESETECGAEQHYKEERSWADLAAVYNKLADAYRDSEEEEHTSEVKRISQRSRSKVLAILGPEASSAL